MRPPACGMRRHDTDLEHRNIGIMFAFLAVFLPAYLLAAELSKPPKSKGEILVFRRARGFIRSFKRNAPDLESQEKTRPVVAYKSPSSNETAGGIDRGTNVFHWEDVCYDIKIKKEDRRLLEHVDGWVKPGVSTILMVS